MPIPTHNPLVLPATPERVYDRWWISRVNITTRNEGAPEMTDAMFIEWRRYRQTDTGYEFSPEAPRQMNVDDVYALMVDETISGEARSLVAEALEKFIGAVARVAAEKGIIE